MGPPVAALNPCWHPDVARMDLFAPAPRHTRQWRARLWVARIILALMLLWLLAACGTPASRPVAPPAAPVPPLIDDAP